MAIRNTAAVYINGVNLTAFVVQPIKWGNLLDERLDEMYLSLRHCPFENFKPLTPVEIHYTNQLYFGSANVGAPETLIKRYLIADDANAAENPVGRGLYDHDLYIIELTKILECVVVDTNTITNVLGRSYVNNVAPIVPSLVNIGAGAVNTPSTYVSPQNSGTSLLCVSITSIWGGGGTFTSLVANHENRNSYLSVSLNGVEQQRVESLTQSLTISLSPGTYSIYYGFWVLTSYSGNDLYAWTEITYTFIALENEFPLKKWTITDVINRLLDIAEPIQQGETPRFRLRGMNTDGTYQAGSPAAKFDTVLAPQFSFTKSTLRECLQQIGGVIHGGLHRVVELLEMVLLLRQVQQELRVLRSGVQLLATPGLVLQLGDRLTVVGEAAAIQNVEKVLGNTVKTLKDPNLASIFIGIILGLVVGAIPIAIPGISSPVKLGMAGGPIVMGILIGAYGPRLHLITYTTRSANLMLRGIGLSLYLACLGLDAGAHFFETVMRPEGALWVGIGFLITFIPVIIMALIALRVYHLDFGNTCGMLCGSMANPMALNYANDIITNDNPSVSYATVYPLGMFSRVIIAQLILTLFL